MRTRDVALGLFAVVILTLSAGLFWMSTLEIPDISTFDTRKITESTKIYDRTGDVLLYDAHGTVKRTVVDSEDISENIKGATVAVEDQNFYTHAGIDIPAIFRAFWANIRAGGVVQGGSTITQQVIKNSLLSTDRTLTRKIKEAVLALKLETVHDKDKILTAYLNEIPYGGTIYGIEEASRAFYSKSASELSIAESAYLAALPKAPTYFSPYGNHIGELESRKNKVIDNMYRSGFISQEERDEAIEEDVDFNSPEEQGIKAPHFVMYILSRLEEEYGEEVVRKNGLDVITTLDWKLHEKAEEIAQEYGERNEERFNAKNTAIVATDPKTGQILTMVGSRNYSDESVDGNVNNTIRNHQPGSSFKPFVYATSFKKGYTPETVLFDVRTQFSTSCSSANMTSEEGCYSPQNYDFATRGPVTIREALAQSINIPAVKALYLSGVGDSIETAQDLGVTTLDPNGDYGLSLVLGAGEVKLLDMTNAYGTFAAEGIHRESTGILEISDAEGEVLEEFEEDGSRVLDREIALQITDILTDNAARTPAFGANSPLYFDGLPVAAKTGTTDEYRDVWTMGYTGDIAVGVWGGNNDNTSMEKRVAGFIITPMWNEVMDFALENGYDAPDFQEPGIDYGEITKPVLRGKVMTDEGSSGVHSILHWVHKDNPRGPIPSNPSSDSQYDHWEYGVQNWATSQDDIDYDESDIENGDEDIELGGGASIDLEGLEQKYETDERLRIEVRVSNMNTEIVEIFINETIVADSHSAPYRFSINLKKYDLEESNVLTVIAQEENGGEISKSFTFDTN